MIRVGDRDVDPDQVATDFDTLEGQCHYLWSLAKQGTYSKRAWCAFHAGLVRLGVRTGEYVPPPAGEVTCSRDERSCSASRPHP